MRRLVGIVITSLCWIQIVRAIDLNVVYHNPSDILYVNPFAGQIILKTKRGSVVKADIVIDSQSVNMEVIYHDEQFEYFVAHLNAFDTTLTYHFILRSAQDTIKFPSSGTFKAKTPLFETPQWASGKTYYAIFPDGFYNGSLVNDPLNKLRWGEKPENWRPYGGDLPGILQKIAYIDSLNPDIILLQPIFSALSNHKLDPIDYMTLDPSFGDTLDLLTLIDEVHKRNKKIVLNVTFTHTGYDFPVFTDIVNKGALSKYVDWYIIDEIPITISPPNYECWRSDYHFPKLNLQNSDVINYLISYLDYWKHFGFDGFYIGEGKAIDANFVKTVRQHLKSKYPNILLLGSGSLPLKGEGFDGCPNWTLTDLIIKYFIQNTLTTSEFDSSLQYLLFFNPPQSNCINQLILSTNDKRIHHVAKEAIVKNLFAFIFTFCGSPVIVSGDEIGMSESAYLNLGSFTWATEGQNRELLNEIKKLITIRKTNPQIAQKYFFTLYVNDINKVYAFDRGGLIVVLNSGDAQSFVRIPAWDGVYIDLMSGEKLIAESQVLRLSIDQKSYRILKREI
jgi:cyclomaltodextrinase